MLMCLRVVSPHVQLQCIIDDIYKDIYLSGEATQYALATGATVTLKRVESLQSLNETGYCGLFPRSLFRPRTVKRLIARPRKAHRFMWLYKHKRPLSFTQQYTTFLIADLKI